MLGLKLNHVSKIGHNYQKCLLRGNIGDIMWLTDLPLDKMATNSEDIFRCIFVNEKFCILMIKISLKFVPKGPIDNNPALV